MIDKPAWGVRVNHGEGVELPGLGLGEGHLGLRLGLGHRQRVAKVSGDLLLDIFHLADENLRLTVQLCIYRLELTVKPDAGALPRTSTIPSDWNFSS